MLNAAILESTVVLPSVERILRQMEFTIVIKMMVKDVQSYKQ